jgi:hypothetical protein
LVNAVIGLYCLLISSIQAQQLAIMCIRTVQPPRGLLCQCWLGRISLTDLRTRNWTLARFCLRAVGIGDYGSRKLTTKKGIVFLAMPWHLVSRASGWEFWPRVEILDRHVVGRPETDHIQVPGPEGLNQPLGGSTRIPGSA